MSVKGAKKKKRAIQREGAKSFFLVIPYMILACFCFEFASSGRFKGRQYERIDRTPWGSTGRQWLRNTGWSRKCKAAGPFDEARPDLLRVCLIISLLHLCETSMADFFSFCFARKQSEWVHAAAVFKMSEKWWSSRVANREMSMLAALTVSGT